MTDQDNPAFPNVADLMQQGEQFARQFFDFVGKRSGGVNAPGVKLPLPETESFIALQKELVEAHTQLWSEMLQRGKDGEVSVARAAPGIVGSVVRRGRKARCTTICDRPTC